MNILIINQPPYNRGDESAHKGLIRTFLKRIPNARIKVVSSLYCMESIRQYAVDSKCVDYLFEPYPSMKFDRFISHDIYTNTIWPWRLHPNYKWYRRIYDWANLVVCAPGGICMGGFQDWDHLFHLKLAKIFHKPLAYYARSFGPFPTETESNRRFKEVSMEMLHYFSFFSVRDHKSELLAEELHIPHVSTVDSAFLDNPNVRIPYELEAVIEGHQYMVFVPNYLLWHYAYHGKITHETIIRFYGKMLDVIWENDPDIHVVMLPQLFCGRNYELCDVDFFRDLAISKNKSQVIVIPDCYSSDIQQSIIHKAQYVIGARYHSIVFAINQGTPCIALSYEHKIAGLMETLGLEDYSIDFTEALFTKENQAKCLSEVKRLIPLLSKEPIVKQKAKDIANACMDKFVERYLK